METVLSLNQQNLDFCQSYKIYITVKAVATTLEKYNGNFILSSHFSTKVNVKDRIGLVDVCRSTPVTLEVKNIDFGGKGEQLKEIDIKKRNIFPGL